MKRKTDTKEKIKQAFIDLINKKGLEAMTVSDIARKSNINRGTFYIHYKDKYDLMEQLELEIIEDLNKIMIVDNLNENPKDSVNIIPFEYMLEALKYVKSDFALIEALASENGDPNFMRMVKDVINNMVMTVIHKSENSKFFKSSFPEDYAQEILLSSIVSIINLWIKKGCKESPEYMTNMITKAIKLAPYDLLF